MSDERRDYGAMPLDEVDTNAQAALDVFSADMARYLHRAIPSIHEPVTVPPTAEATPMRRDLFARQMMDESVQEFEQAAEDERKIAQRRWWAMAAMTAISTIAAVVAIFVQRAG